MSSISYRCHRFPPEIIQHGTALQGRITEKLTSYGAALRSLGASRRHLSGGRLNNRAENSRSPVRQLERRMQPFESPRSLPMPAGRPPSS